jgi:hypothetical protein
MEFPVRVEDWMTFSLCCLSDTVTIWRPLVDRRFVRMVVTRFILSLVNFRFWRGVIMGVV